ncbi:hypothetical protein [Neolewinella litorea]|uniref:Uncharacterized protein n=1 Tax=Neolewinella litorea TaxID=2562452 RepID=A0A4S4NCI7_9BACT|nr:hypothetical protein [Neolewinella litorea]THH36455.1 hypothetical protein E4021_15360 [Neolewinella litorea]
MLQTKADKLLSRITALHRSLQLDDEDDAPSALERDLMLGYLRDLYALYLEVGEKKASSPREMPPRPATPPATPAPEPPPPPPAPVKTPEPEVPATPRQPTPAPAAPPEVPDVPVPPPPAPAMAAHTARVEPQTKPTNGKASGSNAPAAVESLFREPEESSLTNRLMRQRVTDLTRSLSINNRVLFSNKLFGGNEELNAALKDLNLRGSFANAKPLLVELAREHEWAEEERQETAREFIDLVRRRYA